MAPLARGPFEPEGLRVRIDFLSRFFSAAISGHPLISVLPNRFNSAYIEEMQRARDRMARIGH
jgi:hypothetical protein